MKRNRLWNELETQKATLVSLRNQIFQQYKNLVDAVLAGQITEWQEVLDLLLGLIEFGDYYTPAWELSTELAQHIRKDFPTELENSDAFTRVLIEDSGRKTVE